MIVFLTYQEPTHIITGSFTSVIDAYLDVSKYLDVDIKIIWPEKVIFDGWNRFREQNYFGRKELVSKLTEETTFEEETIVCSCKLLADIVQYAKHQKIKVKTKSLILLDSLDLQRYRTGAIANIKDAIIAEHITLLANPANFFMPFKTYEYFHKISKERMKTTKAAEEYYYNRKRKPYIKLPNGLFFENIGKRIWEGIYNGTRVNYAKYGANRDGLYYYLDLFDIDQFKSHYPLMITPQQIEEKLMMNENDLLLQILGG